MYSSRLQELTNYSEIKVLFQANIAANHADFNANFLSQARLSYHRDHQTF